jgi:uncharacterized protein YjbJ (UPF0337 family)
MRQSTKDTVKGTIHEVKGKVKETAGRSTNNLRLDAEGRVEKLGGKVQKKIGHL